MRWLSTCLLSLFLIFLFHSQCYLSSSMIPQCRPDESSALLQLIKTSFLVDHTKTSWWNKSTDCCTWSGIICDTVTGHVIGLNLSSLEGSSVISSNSSLFSLRHLRWLDLSGNDFSGSAIVPEFGQFKNMTRLDLSDSKFEIGSAAFKALAQNSTSSIRELGLSGNDMSLVVPSLSFVNLSSSLTYLDLSSCNLHGKLPESVFRLPKLRVLSLSDNGKLDGSFPKSNWSSPLRKLDLSLTGLSIDLPHLLKSARSLSELSLKHCHIVGSFPVSFGNLTLVYLDLSSNSLSGQIPSASLNLKRLRYLDLSNNNFTGQLPEIYRDSTQNLSFYNSSQHLEADNFPSTLTSLDLSSNSFNGTIPSWIYGLPDLTWLGLSNNEFSSGIREFRSTSLSSLYLGNNKLQGFIPASFFKNIVSLDLLDLSSNSLTGRVELKELSKLHKLSFLDLSSNNLSLTFENSISCAFPNLRYLDMSSCNIRTEFPNFLRCSKLLETIDLSNNKIHGSVPKWLWDMGKDSLSILYLSYNSLTYMEPLPWMSLSLLDLRSNNFSRPLQVSSAPYLQFFLASKNQIRGEISTSFCNMTFLRLLDLSYNDLSGKIPPCLGNSSESLSVLDLRSNRLHGNIPLTFQKDNWLRSLNLNGNQLEGPLPTSLVYCRLLQVLDIGNNLLSGPFPVWLESLPNLQILVLRSNKFHGSIANSKRIPSFSALKIMDLSANEFTGALPIKLFENFIAMMDPKNVIMGYIGEYYYQDSILVTMKGLEIELVKIQNLFTTIDFSRNNLTGEIPESIGKLSSLKGLNLSHNKLTGPIPTSFGNLSNLEWLDLSSNKLVGEIPSQLAANLYQLAFINVSNNELEGSIPRGPQFNTFNNDSYIGNLGLCGFPLSKSCGEPTAEYEGDDRDHDNGLLSWKTVMTGYASGVVIGVSLGYIVFFSGRFNHWLAKRIGKAPQRRRRTNARFRGRGRN